jgi:hypothetical protein
MSVLEEAWVDSYRQFQLQFVVLGEAGTAESVYVTAENGCGSAFRCMVSKVPAVAYGDAGGQHLISLLQPWQKNMVFTVDGGEIHTDYLAEKLLRDGRSMRDVHPGDVAGMVDIVNYAVTKYAELTRLACPGKTSLTLDDADELRFLLKGPLAATEDQGSRSVTVERFHMERAAEIAATLLADLTSPR